MPILNFKPRFAIPVRTGTKRQTIRALRKNPIKVGDTLYLYTGLRTKFARKIGEVECKEVHYITITFSKGRKGWTWIMIKGLTIFNTAKELNDFAVLDGFKDWNDMRSFWIENHGNKFHGTLIKW